MQKPPFFIIGSVRSGTTFLRNVLRQHPNLVCPEETHFFRWSDAFGTPVSLTVLQNNLTLKKHRGLDNVTEEQFKEILQKSTSRADLQRRYMGLYMKQNQLHDKRWFDKTPQNVYGSTIIANDFPGAKFIHIVRNPLNVVSSLRIGHVVKIESIVGACNVWNEAITVLNTLKKAYPKRVYEVKYEDFTTNFSPELEKLLNFVDEDFNSEYFSNIMTTTKEHEHENLFNQQELETIKRLCKQWINHYGY